MKTSNKLSKKLYPIWFLLPFAIIVFIFFILPIIFSVVITFTEFDIRYNPTFIGLENYERIVKDPNLMNIIGISLIYAVAALALVMFMSLLISILTQYFVKQKILRYGYRTIWLAMNALPSIIYAIVIKGVFSPTEDGAANAIMLALGLVSEPIAWFNHIPLLLVILTTGFLSGANGVIILSAAINSIPGDHYKAARIDGSSEFGIVTQIILPSLKWPIMYLTITNAISLISGYMYILLLTDGGPNLKTTTLSLYAYQTAFAGLNFGYGATIALFVVVLSIALVLVMFKLFDFDSMVKPARID